MRKIFLLPVRFYQVAISPLLGPRCRFQPSCSHYFVQAVEEWGIVKGAYLGLKRISKCHPWGSWGYDPVPKRKDTNVKK
ncbi:MAG: membrane protein insertion efficiency factor YidD [Bacteroidetes bacterium]|nr:MAG: membrane protein insertion efficiency factor YidD [Bacteroidota bacterium]